MSAPPSSGLLGVRSLRVPEPRVIEVLRHLRRMGLRRLEGVALWAGVLEGDVVSVRETIIPEQKAARLESGLIYAVDGDELHRINVHLYRSGLLLAAQIHSHPTAAYHSETDDAYPIVTVLGGTSIVVPDFGTGAIDVREWAVYRLYRSGWEPLSPEQANNFISII